MKSDQSTGSDTKHLSAPEKTKADICSFINHELLPPDCGIEVQPQDDLLAIGYLDSMQFMRLVQYVEESCDVKIPPEDLLIEHFQTVNQLHQYLSARHSRQ